VRIEREPALQILALRMSCRVHPGAGIQALLDRRAMG